MPYASLLLTSYGATTLRVDRPHPHAHSSKHDPPLTRDLLATNKQSIALNLRSPESLALLLDLIPHIDILIEPFRPGVLESLGLAPARLLQLNPRLIIARLTGFRRDGKYSKMAGHDINYLAVSGVLAQLGGAGAPPYFPSNILADFAGGGLMCAFGILLALFSRNSTGKGQVVEANMVDGVQSLSSMMRFGLKTEVWDQPRGYNMLDGGAPWYDVYETKDGQYMAVGALEPQFFRGLIKGLGLGHNLETKRNERENWQPIRELFAKTFKSRTRKEWEAVFDGTDACVTPVLEFSELEEQDYDIRESVTLTNTPGREIKSHQMWMPHSLGVGEGGEDVLRKWVGWRRSVDFGVKDGTLIKMAASKL